MSEQDPVLMETVDGVAVVVLNRPEKRNAANVALQRGLLHRFRQLGQGDGVDAVILTGAGPVFCAGGDVSMIPDVTGNNEVVRAELGELHEGIVTSMLELTVPLIAAVNGPAVGFGAELLALCDIVIMADDAFISDPHVKHGLGPAPTLELVWPHLTSRAVAKELLMSGRRVPAEEALRLGLVNRLAPPDRLREEAMDTAQTLAALPRAAVASVKATFNRELLEWIRAERPA